MNTEDTKEIVEPTTPESFEIEKSPTAGNEEGGIKAEVIPTTESAIVEEVPTSHYLSLTQVHFVVDVFISSLVLLLSRISLELEFYVLLMLFRR